MVASTSTPNPNSPDQNQSAFILLLSLSPYSLLLPSSVSSPEITVIPSTVRNGNPTALGDISSSKARIRSLSSLLSPSCFIKSWAADDLFAFSLIISMLVDPPSLTAKEFSPVCLDLKSLFASLTNDSMMPPKNSLAESCLCPERSSFLAGYIGFQVTCTKFSVWIDFLLSIKGQILFFTNHSSSFLTLKRYSIFPLYSFDFLLKGSELKTRANCCKIIPIFLLTSLTKSMPY